MWHKIKHGREKMTLKKGLNLLYLATMCLFVSCNPKVSTEIVKSYPQVSTDEKVEVIEKKQVVPENAEVLGSVKIGEGGFTSTKKCSYYTLIEIAKGEARKVGGNAIKITRHRFPDRASTCHRITAEILRIKDIDSYVFGALRETEQEPEILSDTNYTILNIYRMNDIGKKYNLFLEDSFLCTVKKDFKTTIMLKESGRHTLWLKGYNKDSVTIDLEHGKRYYLQCSYVPSTTGLFGDSPQILLMDEDNGKFTFESFTSKRDETTQTIAAATERETDGGNASNKESIRNRASYIDRADKKFTIGFDAGYGGRLAKIAETVPQAYLSHIEALERGVNFSGEFTTYFNQTIGLGLIFSEQISSDSRYVNSYVNSYSDIPLHHKIDDRIRLPYIGANLSFRAYSMGRHALLCGISMGYAGYRNKGNEDYVKYTYKGGNLGMMFNIEYQFWVAEHAAFSVKFYTIASSLSNLRYVDDVLLYGQEQTIQLKDDQKESLFRAGITLGLKFGK